MNVLSLFDWCSCAYQALHNLWIEPKHYFSSELDKYTIEISRKNWRWRIMNLWDVRRVWKIITIYPGNKPELRFLPEIDLLIWGPPCQDLSIAGKRKWLKWERSWLFREYVRILREVKPKYFLMENVASMSKENRDIISKELGVEPILINSALLTAQNRRRLYRTNIPGVTQPDDKGIFLKDILIDWTTEDLKSYCVTANYQKLTAKDYQKGKGQVVRIGHFNKWGQADRIYSIEGKSVTINSGGWGKWGKTWLYKVGNIHPSGKWMNWDVYDDIGKSPTLTTNKWEWPKIVQRARGFNKWGEHTEKSPTVWSSCRHENNKLHHGDIVRKLTPVECERLQGLPDGYTEWVSNAQRYKMIWNWFTVPVIQHILSFLPEILWKK